MLRPTPITFGMLEEHPQLEDCFISIFITFPTTFSSSALHFLQFSIVLHFLFRSEALFFHKTQTHWIFMSFSSCFSAYNGIEWTILLFEAGSRRFLNEWNFFLDKRWETFNEMNLREVSVIKFMNVVDKVFISFGFERGLNKSFV